MPTYFKSLSSSLYNEYFRITFSLRWPRRLLCGGQVKGTMVSIIVMMLLLAYCAIQNNSAETYTTKYDGIELKEILANDRILTNYVNCLLDEGPCTPDGKELKKNLPDAISNDCKKCTERQRTGADEVMHYLIDHRPDDWMKLEEKYNSDGSYKTNYLNKRENAEDKSSVRSSSEDGNNTSNQ